MNKASGHESHQCGKIKRKKEEKYIQQYRKNIENGNHEYTESLYKLIKSYKIN